jgi:CRP/FNR family nitrogen fixation transcriptional regulator
VQRYGKTGGIMLIETDTSVSWRHEQDWGGQQPNHFVGATSTFTGTSRPLTLYEAGEEIFGPASRGQALFQVAFGVARVCSVLNDGRRTITAFHLPGEIFGFEPAGSPFRAEAVEGLGLRMLPLPRDRSLASELQQVALSSLAAAQEHLLVVGRQTAVERIAAFLIDMGRRQKRSDVIDLPMPRSDIADSLALTPETVCRVFKQLRERHLIDFKSSRRVTMRSQGALQALID